MIEDNISRSDEGIIDDSEHAVNARVTDAYAHVKDLLGQQVFSGEQVIADLRTGGGLHAKSRNRTEDTNQDALDAQTDENAYQYAALVTMLDEKLQTVVEEAGEGESMQPYTVAQLTANAKVDNSLRKRAVIMRYAKEHGVPVEGFTYMLTSQQRNALLTLLNEHWTSPEPKKKK